MIPKFLPLITGLVVVTCAFAQAAPPGGDAWLESQPRIFEIAGDHAGVDRLLSELQRRYPDFQQRLRAVALLRLGTPYVLGCLGEERPPDTKPVFRLDVSDCTVHVLTCSALAHAHTWNEAREWMKKLNYYPASAASGNIGGRAPAHGPITYENRVHFTEDRIVTSTWYRTAQAPFEAARPASVTLTLNRSQEGKPALAIPWQKPMTIRYLPVSEVTPTLLERLPSPVAGVAFVRKKLFPQGLVVAHEGLVIDQKWLVHANSIKKETVKVDFLAYLKKNADWFDGVIFFENLP